MKRDRERAERQIIAEKKMPNIQTWRERRAEMNREVGKEREKRDQTNRQRGREEGQRERKKLTDCMRETNLQKH